MFQAIFQIYLRKLIDYSYTNFSIWPFVCNEAYRFIFTVDI